VRNMISFDPDDVEEEAEEEDEEVEEVVPSVARAKAPAKPETAPIRKPALNPLLGGNEDSDTEADEEEGSDQSPTVPLWPPRLSDKVRQTLRITPSIIVTPPPPEETPKRARTSVRSKEGQRRSTTSLPEEEPEAIAEVKEVEVVEEEVVVEVPPEKPAEPATPPRPAVPVPSLERELPLKPEYVDSDDEEWLYWTTSKDPTFKLSRPSASAHTAAQSLVKKEPEERRYSESPYLQRLIDRGCAKPGPFDVDERNFVHYDPPQIRKELIFKQIPGESTPSTCSEEEEQEHQTSSIGPKAARKIVSRLQGDMSQFCTYIQKQRALMEHLHGDIHHFCSYIDKHEKNRARTVVVTSPRDSAAVYVEYDDDDNDDDADTADADTPTNANLEKAEVVGEDEEEEEWADDEEYDPLQSPMAVNPSPTLFRQSTTSLKSRDSNAELDDTEPTSNQIKQRWSVPAPHQIKSDHRERAATEITMPHNYLPSLENPVDQFESPDTEFSGTDRADRIVDDFISSEVISPRCDYFERMSQPSHQPYQSPLERYRSEVDNKSELSPRCDYFERIAMLEEKKKKYAHMATNPLPDNKSELSPRCDYFERIAMLEEKKKKYERQNTDAQRWTAVTSSAESPRELIPMRGSSLGMINKRSSEAQSQRYTNTQSSLVFHKAAPPEPDHRLPQLGSVSDVPHYLLAPFAARDSREERIAALAGDKNILERLSRNMTESPTLPNPRMMMNTRHSIPNPTLERPSHGRSSCLTR